MSKEGGNKALWKISSRISNQIKHFANTIDMIIRAVLEEIFLLWGFGKKITIIFKVFKIGRSKREWK